MTDAGMVTCAPKAVWKVPPASMLDGGAVVSDTTVGKLVVPDTPDTVQVKPVPSEAVPLNVVPSVVIEKLSPSWSAP